MRRLLILAATAAFALAAPRLQPRDDTHDAHHDHHAMANASTSHMTQLDEHSAHNSHAAPLLQLNETEVLLHHAPDPPSYWSHDFEGDHPHDEGTWPALMLFHVLGMSLAFFVFLPITIVLRAAKHPLRWLAQVAFNAFLLVGSFSATLYNKLTPNLYQGSVHGKSGYIALLVVIALSVVDAVHLIRRAFSYFTNTRPITLRGAWDSIVAAKEPLFLARDFEYDGLVQTPDEYDDSDHSPTSSTPRHAHFDEPLRPGEILYESSDWANEEVTESPRTATTFYEREIPMRRFSGLSESTLRDPSVHSPTRTDSPEPRAAAAPPASRLQRLGTLLFDITERVLVVYAYTLVLSGATVYTGICRGNYINGCMAHLIKGSIFLLYGVLTFARYLGAFADLGWAWNRLPHTVRRRQPPSAEMVESSLIFLYGVTNTWMERFGAEPGSPYTTKQVQHISIAVMFWFAGLVGMGLESGLIRRLLSAPAVHADGRAREQIPQPASALGSFNPFPALVIGVTGAAMSAHHQTYLFQVQIHALWGYLLLAFAVLRFFTYFFLWLRPPRSVLPSRPPTEALASFFLACGGFTFILSTEQIGFAAMRRGHADIMMHLNLVVAVICFIFTWCMGILAFRGWAVAAMSSSSRSNNNSNTHADATGVPHSQHAISRAKLMSHEESHAV
ncbi:hypothetical protein BOTBODRAFT_31175 [Botryobasidium botryosum FD-172 SS1]|uniref:Protein YTP1-like C-terminal domain-containing protein n=1 Tax=Botryobasidium botryosum (strain FD-172 SS1) TaxID=930990 RepID=A0A067MX17_BOTB1|nr:hypothetical protein BOTBODRAFT_31175 [Botryobasidium botryosum FD-172 SS1]